jgi:hypothetical protein
MYISIFVSRNTNTKLKKAIYFQQNIGISGAFLSLTMYFLLWIRYKKYGFEGVKEVILKVLYIFTIYIYRNHLINLHKFVVIILLKIPNP